jgi:hypothetical protein
MSYRLLPADLNIEAYRKLYSYALFFVVVKRFVSRGRIYHVKGVWVECVEDRIWA